MKTLLMAGLGLVGLTACSGTVLPPVSEAVVDEAPDLVGAAPRTRPRAAARSGAAVDPVAILGQSGTLRSQHGPRFAATDPAPGQHGAGTRPSVRVAAVGPAAFALGAAPAAALSPLAEVEVKSARAQRIQEDRDRLFDARVRRATGLVCDGCTGPARRAAAPPPASSDEGE